MMPGQLRAMQEAAQLLSHLGLDTTQPVDPFKAIDDLQLELRFERMADLWGVIIPADPPHVIINNQLPASVQRFTAAHEIGHWVLDNEQLTLDKAAEIHGHSSVTRERNAQIFAGHFMMPLPLVYEAAAAHGVRKGEPVSAQQVYEMARDMHVSYTAAVHQLANVNFLTNAKRTEYLRMTPASLKRQLTYGLGMANARGDVWPVEVSRDSLDVEVFAGDEIVISLVESPSTGFTWMPLEAGWTYRANGSVAELALEGFVGPKGPSVEVDSGAGEELELPTIAPLAIVNDVFVENPDVGVSIGGAGNRVVGLATMSAGEWSVEMRHVRPFAPDQILEEIELRAHVRALPQDEAKLRWIRAFREEDAALAHIERGGAE